MKRLHPAVHLAVTEIMADSYGLSPTAAAEAATRLIGELQAADLDIVKGDWMNAPQKQGGFQWEDLQEAADGFLDDRNGIPPWKPYWSPG